jgi:hypothetical protein
MIKKDQYLLAERTDFPKHVLKDIFYASDEVNCGFKINSMFFEICYWRNSDAIHNWFVSNITNFQYNGEKYRVEYNSLLKLYNLVSRIYTEYYFNKNSENAETFARKYLPTNTGYDLFYYTNIKKTYEQLTHLTYVFSDNDLHYYTFYYQVL